MDISTIFVVLLAAAFPVLFVAALVSIAKHPTASGTEKGLWILISLVAAVIGPILWFAVGKDMVGKSPIG